MILRNTLSRVPWLLTVLAAVGLSAHVWAASPRLSLILPRGVQRGAEHVVTFSGSNLQDAQEIFFYEPGFEVTKLEPEARAVKVHLKVAADCRLGEHVAQVRTASGISDYRTLFVSSLPAAAEKEPNSDFAAPQAIELNQTIEGVIQAEDVDYFAVTAKEGQRISVEVEAMRLGTQLFDPYVAILNQDRFELAAADDTPLLLQDAATSLVVPEDGTYVVAVREAAYGGNGNCRYRLHVGTFPRPLAVFPAGGKAGDKLKVRFLGDPAGELEQEVQLPADPNDEYGLFAQDGSGIAPSPNPFRVTDAGNAFEKEPNNGLAEATPVELPLAFNGIIEEANDVDCFRFQAKKGQVFEIECYARRIRSPLDPVMNLYGPDGKSLQGNDDSRGPDSYFRYTFPADGQYTIRVTDHLHRGGPTFVYRIELQPIRPRLALGIPRVERYGQYRQTVFVPRGNRFGVLLNVSRNNLGGDVVIDGGELPAGLTMHTETVPANLNATPVVFEAAEDAPLGGRLVDFQGHCESGGKTIVGRFRNRADFIIGPPGQSLFRWKDVDRLAVAVVDKLPFRLEIVEPKVPLVRNGSMQLKIVAHREEGFDKDIRVEFPFRPPGVGTTSAITIAKDKSEAFYPINANGNARIGKFPIFALGSADAGGRAWVSSQLAHLEVAAPFVTASLPRASCEQGQETEILCTLNHATPFEGEAVAQLLGLPAKVTAEPQKFTKDTKEIVFHVKTDPASPAGKHGSIVCQVTITQNGEPIVNRAGTVELQIDKPLPPSPGTPPQPKPQPVAAKKPAAETPPKKPLSRLEKLRLAAQQRKQQAQQQDGAP